MTRTFTLALVAATLVTSASVPALAQPVATTTRWQSEVRELDAVVRDRALTSGDPRMQWVAGEIERGDPASRVGYLAEARRQVPRERLYISSLALACLEPMRPLPPACDAMDRLADWATRDEGNGLPELLLAERAQARRNIESMIGHLGEGVRRQEFVDYHDRGALFMWEELRALPARAELAAKAELVESYGLPLTATAQRVIDALCSEPRSIAENERAACEAAGRALVARGATWSLRLAGARLVERTAATPAARVAAQTDAEQLRRQAFECAAKGNTLAFALDSADAAMRARAVSDWEEALVRNAELGEVEACVRSRPP